MLSCVTDSETFDLLSTVEFDQEGGLPIKMNIEELNIAGFHSNPEENWGYFKFIAPVTLIGSPFRAKPVVDQDNNNTNNKEQPEVTTVFFCIPVSPGRCRVIWANGYNLDGWFDKMIPRWWLHIKTNQVLDSDSSVLHIEERNYAAFGLDNWHKACYVPTSSDNLIIAFRNWFKKYCNNQVGWLTPMVNQLPPASTRVEVYERYWSHVHKNSKACVASYPSVVQNNIFVVLPEADEVKKKKNKKPEVRVVLFTVPVAPGRSRFIWASRYKVGGWLDKILPRWFYHMTSNTILDSDTYLHVEDRNITTVGLDNWHKACYVPTSSDNLVIAYRNWFRKYCNHQIGCANPNPTVKQQLPQTPTRDQLLERYWSHVMQCTSCRAALKGMRALEIILQVAAVAVVGFLAAGKETAVMSGVQRAAVVAAAVLCFAASRWLANFIEKTFYFQDYVHADK
uniref:Pheophorbide a oxygenase domain-containing protein n=1 Tax=Oryza nivara TaxID=4536 RepID=A0A0E0GV82_ORYNI